jgi:hypothetical protein
MIVYDLDVPDVAIFPTKACAPLIIDANAESSGAIAFERLQAIPGGRFQEIQRGRVVQESQLSLDNGLNGTKTSRTLALEQGLRVFASERLDHGQRVLLDA